LEKYVSPVEDNHAVTTIDEHIQFSFERQAAGTDFTETEPDHKAKDMQKNILIIMSLVRNIILLYTL